MKLIVLTLILVFSMGFFVLAWLQNESRRGGYAMLAGFFFLLMAGLLAAVFNVEYRSGYTLDTTAAPEVIVYTYDSLSTTEALIVGLPLVISGLWGLIIVSLAIREDRNVERYA